MIGAVAQERLSALYGAADVFVLASRYEGYGMAFAEAIAHGLPVVGTTAGAIPGTVPPEAGVLVPPEDIDALAAVLRSLIVDRARRETLRAGALSVRTRFPTWRDAATRFAAVLDSLP
jgi:glycosyltransferase involved in cell wall biosynthesis